MLLRVCNPETKKNLKKGNITDRESKERKKKRLVLIVNVNSISKAKSTILRERHIKRAPIQLCRASTHWGYEAT